MGQQHDGTGSAQRAGGVRDSDGLVEHPDHPGLFYDPLIVYIPTGDPAKDAEYRTMRAAETLSFSHRWDLGAARG